MSSVLSLHQTRPCHTTVFYTTPYYTRSHYNALHGTVHHLASLTPCCATPDSAMLHHTALHYITLYYKIFPSLICFTRAMWSSDCLHKAVVIVSLFAWHVECSITHWFSSQGVPQHRRLQQITEPSCSAQCGLADSLTTSWCNVAYSVCRGSPSPYS